MPSADAAPPPVRPKRDVGLRRAVRYATTSSGVRASALLLLAYGVVNGGTYLYQLVCIRWLGPSHFSDVASMTALATIVSLPFTGLQAALAREVARLESLDRPSAIRSLLRASLRRATLIQLALVAVLAAGSPLVTRLLHLPSVGIALAGMAPIVFAVSLPVLQGMLQGLNRFGALAADWIVLGISRPLLAAPFILAFGTMGALLSGVASAGLGVIVALVLLRAFLRGPAEGGAPLGRGSTAVLVGLVAFSALTNMDVLVAKAALSSHLAGTYASAALVGKIAIYLPTAVSTVLLPRATAQLERGESASRMIGLSLLVVLGFGLVYSLVLLAVPTSLVELAFGPEFGAARSLLAPCAATMTLCGLLNVQLIVAFARRDDVFVWLTAVAVGLQGVLLAFLHDSGYEILLGTAIAALFALAANEIRSPAGVYRLARVAAGQRASRS